MASTTLETVAVERPEVSMVPENLEPTVLARVDQVGPDLTRWGTDVPSPESAPPGEREYGPLSAPTLVMTALPPPPRGRSSTLKVPVAQPPSAHVDAAPRAYAGVHPATGMPTSVAVDGPYPSTDVEPAACAAPDASEAAATATATQTAEAAEAVAVEPDATRTVAVDVAQPVAVDATQRVAGVLTDPLTDTVPVTTHVRVGPPPLPPPLPAPPPVREAARRTCLPQRGDVIGGNWEIDQLIG